MKTSTTKRELILFSRYPQAGSTKKRLIPLLGAEAAARLQKALIEHVTGIISGWRDRGETCVTICYDDGNDDLFRKWIGDSFHYSAQARGHIGIRMSKAIEAAFQRGSERVCLLGTDIPGIDSTLLSDAFEKLESADIVLGPAFDGGYYLIGMNKLHRQLFDDMAWSTASVAQETLRRAASAGLRVARLKQLHDVDEPHDLVHIPFQLRSLALPLQKVRLSIIIPTLNEAAQISHCLDSIQFSADSEVLLVDGGSEDDTLLSARNYPVKIVNSSACRSRQMNIGAALAGGEILLFLHGDTRLPVGYVEEVTGILSTPSHICGAFSLAIENADFGMRVTSWTANLRARYHQFPYGDQGIFIRSRDFFRFRGFSDIDFMEDFEFVSRLRNEGTIVISPLSAVTSRRRWAKLGFWRSTLINKMVIIGFKRGVAPSKLKKLYNSLIK